MLLIEIQLQIRKVIIKKQFNVLIHVTKSKELYELSSFNAKLTDRNVKIVRDLIKLTTHINTHAKIKNNLWP